LKFFSITETLRIVDAFRFKKALTIFHNTVGGRNGAKLCGNC
jgi:hypothetical protein